MTKTISVPSLLITGTEGDYSVWISLEQHDPVLDPYGFIIGTSDTRDGAVADAVASLEAAIDQLQAPRGVVPEREDA